MHTQEEYVEAIALDVVVNGEVRLLEVPIPFDYDVSELLQLVMRDIVPLGADSSVGDDVDLDAVAGEMDALVFDEWRERADDLEEIEFASFDLDDMGLIPGRNPGLYDLHSDEPAVGFLDETIENDLHNARIVANTTKAAFRAMRETCGASQAALADALGVNTRAVKRWETPGQPEPPYEARRLVENWHADAVAGAHWHVRRAEELRDECHEAYTLILYRNQAEFDRALAPLLAQAPSYRWQDALAESREDALDVQRDDSFLDVDHAYTNFPGTRSFWRANAAAKMAALLMAERRIPHGFAYPDEQLHSLYWDGVWVPRADVQHIEAPGGTMVVCGMR